MRIIQSNSKEEAVLKIAEMIVGKIESRPSLVIGLATGRTMEPLYKAWLEIVRKGGIDQGQCRFFMLDEYLGIPSDHPSSFRTYIKEKFLKPSGLAEKQFFFPSVENSDTKAAAMAYEKSIQDVGGIDLQILGIGTNGHIGFNEPASEPNSRTRQVVLSAETIKANRSSFEGEMPTEALTMGIGTILEARELLLLATGSSKAQAIKALLNHDDDPACPATYLKRHRNFTVVLDPQAASEIKQ